MSLVRSIWPPMSLVTTRVRSPCLEAYRAAVSPAAEPPMMTTSYRPDMLGPRRPPSLSGRRDCKMGEGRAQASFRLAGAH